MLPNPVQDGSIPSVAKEHINEIDYEGLKLNLLKYREETVEDEKS
ncbi:hypothetical protein [Clostridium sp. KNHs205]|nr:hypothetical protein [Clostridium sp. KNHs205]